MHGATAVAWLLVLERVVLTPSVWYGVSVTRRQGCWWHDYCCRTTIIATSAIAESRRGDDRLMEWSPEQPSYAYLPARQPLAPDWKSTRYKQQPPTYIGLEGDSKINTSGAKKHTSEQRFRVYIQILRLLGSASNNTEHLLDSFVTQNVMYIRVRRPVSK